jgi:hypothetical protein
LGNVEYQTIEVWSEIDNYITLLGLEKKLGVPEERQGAVHASDSRRASG